MWFAETPWPPIFLCLVGIAGIFLIWKQNQKKEYLFVMGGLAIACIGIFTMEMAIVTEKERIEQHIHDMVWAFQKQEEEKCKSYLSQQAVPERGKIELALRTVRVHDDLRITDVDIELTNEDSIALSIFRANATVSYKMGGAQSGGHHPSRWLFTWRLEAGEWKVTKIEQLELIGDKRKETGIPK